MTVPGKGGRPQKWRSDADRVRAYRARQRGAPEPPILAAALDEGDELAAALEYARELGQRLEKRRKVERSLRRELVTARRELEEQQARFGWLCGDNDALRTRLADAERARGEIEERLKALTRENFAMQQRLVPVHSAATPAVDTTERPSTNRAQRRRAARNARRRS